MTAWLGAETASAVNAANTATMLNERMSLSNCKAVGTGDAQVPGHKQVDTDGQQEVRAKDQRLLKTAGEPSPFDSVVLPIPHFCWSHDGIDKKTPAQAIGLADQKHDLDWIVDLIDERAAKPKRPKIYKKRVVRVPETVTVDPSTIGVTQHVASAGRKLNLPKTKPVRGERRVPVNRLTKLE